MSYQNNLTVSYHQQDTGIYCGAACAQMVLDSVGAGLLNQDDLYSDNHNNTSWDQNLYNSFGQKIEWATPPDGLAWTLNNHDPQVGPTHHTYVEYPLNLYPYINSEDGASRKIAWTIEHYGVAPCALVMKGAHWVAVTGMDVSDKPESSDDTNYTINSFRINDPWPPVPSASDYWPNPSPPPPPPHSASDGCGTGGNRGVANQIVSYSYWQSDYMTAANYHPQGHWQGLFVAVCDPDPPAVRRGHTLPRIRHFDGIELISHRQAIQLAIEIIGPRHFPQEGAWQHSLGSGMTGIPYWFRDSIG